MLERQVTEHTTAHHETSEAYHQHSQEIQFLQAKVIDLEDRSGRNNTKFRGIPETIKPPDLIHYIQQLFIKLIPQLSQADLAIDHAHRIAKPNYGETCCHVFISSKLKNKSCLQPALVLLCQILTPYYRFTQISKLPLRKN